MLGVADHEAVPLLGRVEEQRLLTSLLDDARTRGHALVLRGEPGIGKSRLLSVTERAARDRGHGRAEDGWGAVRDASAVRRAASAAAAGAPTCGPAARC